MNLTKANQAENFLITPRMRQRPLNVNIDLSSIARDIILVTVFIYMHTLCMRAVKVLARQCLYVVMNVRACVRARMCMYVRAIFGQMHETWVNTEHWLNLLYRL